MTINKSILLGHNPFINIVKKINIYSVGVLTNVKQFTPNELYILKNIITSNICNIDIGLCLHDGLLVEEGKEENFHTNMFGTVLDKCLDGLGKRVLFKVKITKSLKKNTNRLYIGHSSNGEGIKNYLFRKKNPDYIENDGINSFGVEIDL